MPILSKFRAIFVSFSNFLTIGSKTVEVLWGVHRDSTHDSTKYNEGIPIYFNNQQNSGCKFGSAPVVAGHSRVLAQAACCVRAVGAAHVPQLHTLVLAVADEVNAISLGVQMSHPLCIAAWWDCERYTRMRFRSGFYFGGNVGRRAMQSYWSRVRIQCENRGFAKIRYYCDLQDFMTFIHIVWSTLTRSTIVKAMVGALQAVSPLHMHRCMTINSALPGRERYE